MLVSQAHDTVARRIPVNASMERTTRTGAALAALFSLSLPAQQEPSPTPAYRLAQAKLLEARGDVAAARRTLEEALAQANDADRASLQAALAALPQDGKTPASAMAGNGAGQSDGPAEARLRALLQFQEAQLAPTQDPVARLLAVLERGPFTVPEIAEASAQLETLGPLVVPPLLAALPKAGPFGVGHAIRILGHHTDARIAPAILARANADPAIAQLAIEASQDMHDAVRAALLTGLDETKLPPAVQRQFAEVMDSVPGLEPRRRALVTRLADEPSVQGDLVQMLRQENAPWVRDVLARLRTANNPTVAASATLYWLMAQPTIDEASALPAIQALEPRHRWWVARQVTQRHTSWAKVAVLGLGGDLDNLDTQPWFQKVEWRRGGAEAALALLAVAKADPEVGKRLVGHFCDLAAAGWTVPPEHEGALAALWPGALAMALPADDEARALAAWNRLEPDARVRFVDKFVDLERPWHRVVGAQLASVEKFDDVHDAWLQRDWTGTPPDAAAALVALAERFPSMPNGYAERPRPATSGPRNWLPLLVRACERTPELPPAILVALVRAGDTHAWRALTRRAPVAALAIARAPDNPWHEGLPRLLGEHGTADDVPTLERLLGWHGLSRDEVELVRPFVLRHGLGNPTFLQRLAESHEPAERSLATRIAARLQIAQLEEFLCSADLPIEVAEAAIRALQSQVRTADAPALAKALASTAAREPLSPWALSVVLDLMTRCGSTECLPALRKALADARLGDWRSQIAATMISLPGPEWPAMLRDLLAHPDARVVGAALVAVRPGQDRELLAVATKALVANLRTLPEVDAFFDGLEPAARAEAANAVLQAPDFDQCSAAVATCALRALGSLKDARFATDLARGARHQDAMVRCAAAEQLGRLFVREAAPFLLDLLKDDHQDVRNTAKERLELLGDYLDGRAKWDARLQPK